MINQILFVIIQLIVIGILSIIGIVFYFLLNNLLVIMKALTNQTPKIVYLSYKECIVYLKSHTKDVFDLDYATTILPDLSSENGVPNSPIPNQKAYLTFITSCTLHVMQSLGTHLRKSLGQYYTDIELRDTIIKTIKKLLDSHVAKHAMAVKMTGKNNLKPLTSIMGVSDTPQVRKRGVK